MEQYKQAGKEQILAAWHCAFVAGPADAEDQPAGQLSAHVHYEGGRPGHYIALCLGVVIKLAEAMANSARIAGWAYSKLGTKLGKTPVALAQTALFQALQRAGMRNYGLMVARWLWSCGGAIVCLFVHRRRYGSSILERSSAVVSTSFSVAIDHSVAQHAPLRGLRRACARLSSSVGLRS